MEPMLPGDGAYPQLDDMAFELTQAAAGLAGRVNDSVRGEIENLVRSMNCYYSNLIEGHNTHPRSIERALQEDFEREPEKRALQLEALAHIELQAKIDRGEDPADAPTSKAYLCWLHHEFMAKLSDEFLWVEDPVTKKQLRVVPGELRKDEVRVGRHEAPLASALPRSIDRFVEAYNPERLSKFRQVVSVGAAHHRFLWIHPFLDGNGRVVRLLSHAQFRRLGFGNGLWSVARGLARSEQAYKAKLQGADEPRRGSLDGRGTLTEAGLVEFIDYFLKTAIDQVEYMAGLLDFDTLTKRIERWAIVQEEEKRIYRGSYPLLREVLLAGQVDRSAVETLTNVGDRQARNVVAKLMELGVLQSAGPRAPLRLAFPLDVVDAWFPQLYPADRIRAPL
jgi:Fic family protein